MCTSYRSPKTRVAPSPIAGRGLFAAEPIAAGELVAVKGGHVYGTETLRQVERAIADSYLQIADGLFLGALRAEEVATNKLYVNHSCAPNLGLRGHAAFHAMRDIAAGEELTYDWAMEDTSTPPMPCRCGASGCRGMIGPEDWRDPALQAWYAGWFSTYLEDKIRRLD